MKPIVRALVWEQVWKNRMVFPILASLGVLGGGLTWLLTDADPTAWWLRTAQRTLLIAFFASVLLCYAPFTLMESAHGWRMNSMVTRWFVLPVRTSTLVGIPFVAACLVVSLCLGLWMLMLRRLQPGLDYVHVYLVLVAGVAAMQTLAWALPRKPSQFWPLLALGFPALLLAALLPLDSAAWEPHRRLFRATVPIALPLLGVLAYAAARFNRCGAWPGEIPLRGLTEWLLRGQPSMPRLTSPAAALFWSEVVPVVRTFVLTWVGFVLLVLGLQVFQFVYRSNSHTITLALLMQVGTTLIPPLGICWLAVGGLFLGTDSSTGFGTALSPFRAVRPVSVGALAAQRLLAAACLWLIVWIPWLALLAAHTHLHPKWAGLDLPEIYTASGRLMALSAHVLIGALPLFLWGRLDGFPNVLLAAIAAWAGTWGLTSLLVTEPDAPRPWLVLGLLLMAKGVAGTAGLIWAWRAGHVTWRYPVALVSSWAALCGLLGWALPTWQQSGAWGVALIAAFLPFARLGLAPLALATNRHR